MSDQSLNSLVVDIGKTHIKICLLDARNNPVRTEQTNNVIDSSGAYPSVDVDYIWTWLSENIKLLASSYHISAIAFSTHGATAALINRDKEELVLPVLDYEYNELDKINEPYLTVKPLYEKTFSPPLPAGLNLGKQLFWLQHHFATKFNQCTDILMYPQYWAWKLTGEVSTDITSLGCHTDLWSIADNDFSSLVDTMNWRHLFPKVMPPWHCVGQIKPQLAQAWGLGEQCQVHVGIHDSNASFLRYRVSQDDRPFTVISTGTWTISMAANVSLENLSKDKDMLANIDATGKAVACARFMGGREFASICKRFGANVADKFSAQDIQHVINSNVFALPDFSGGSGPFGHSEGCILGNKKTIKGAALASLYCALMLDYQLDTLKVSGDIYIEGAFLKNPFLCGLLSQLRGDQNVYLSTDTTGTVQGVAQLMSWGKSFDEPKVEPALKTSIENLVQYKAQWLSAIQENL
ncbi:FGGY-family carbohydrate kinase [Catenovulum adriaticum]|uniref:FGGY family carbohydrate kinase n=1 Tax=Catenovulum adriaticum TaxID=2984846 RepID=A0ABY7ARD2_9ALTE|nr:FGGY family carbohydrate kinase [Catenovulum sp. TS8]WAJ71813.1 FGGY family carbohydrate kinase [Catenovulum sp. TS8]